MFCIDLNDPHLLACVFATRVVKSYTLLAKQSFVEKNFCDDVLKNVKWGKSNKSILLIRVLLNWYTMGMILELIEFAKGLPKIFTVSN